MAAVLLIWLAGCTSTPEAPLEPLRFDYAGPGQGSQAMLERDGAACRYEIAQTRPSPTVAYDPSAPAGQRLLVAGSVPRDEDGMFMDCMRARGWVSN